MKLLRPINATILEKGGGGTDIGPWMVAGVPGASLKNENERYFYFHHSNGKSFMTFLAIYYLLFKSSIFLKIDILLSKKGLIN